MIYAAIIYDRCVCRNYDFETLEFGTVYTYRAGYLPKEYILKLLELYKEKTNLKDVEGCEAEYTIIKSIMNASAFGIMVQDPLKKNVTYENGKWEEETKTEDDLVNEYNDSSSRFTFYPWGLFVCSYSRSHLIDCIIAMRDDFVYSDTDSAKIYNGEQHEEWFNRYNAWIKSRICKMLDFYGIDRSYIEPKNKYGEVKELGAWEFEGVAEAFKTIGQKRYLSYKNGRLDATVSGVNSEGVEAYLSQFEDPFKMFDGNVTVPSELTGRTTSYLIKTEREGIVTDRDGIKRTYCEPYGVYIRSTEYNFTFTDLTNYKATTISKI